MQQGQFFPYVFFQGSIVKIEKAIKALANKYGLLAK